MIELIDLREAPTEQTIAWLGVLAANLRPADLAEIDATTDQPPAAALEWSVRLSEMAWVMLADGEPFAIWGCGPSGCPDSGVVWMMGTPAVDTHGTAFGRAALRSLDHMHGRYACLWNYIDARNERSMRWLRWMRFELLEAHPSHGLHGLLFFTFARYRPHVSSPHRGRPRGHR